MKEQEFTTNNGMELVTKEQELTTNSGMELVTKEQELTTNIGMELVMKEQEFTTNNGMELVTKEQELTTNNGMELVTKEQELTTNIGIELVTKEQEVDYLQLFTNILKEQELTTNNGMELVIKEKGLATVNDKTQFVIKESFINNGIELVMAEDELITEYITEENMKDYSLPFVNEEEDLRKNIGTDEDDGIEHIETVTNHDWVVDTTLPEGWKRRPLIEHYNQRKRGSMVVTKYQYLSPEQVIFNSRKEIMAYMDSYTSIPNQDQIH